MGYLANKGSSVRARPAGGPACNERGVTLVELLFAIMVIAILTVIAIPSFRDATLSGRLSAISSDLYTSVQLARSEAIKSNATRTLCTSSDGLTCASSTAWGQGWIIIDGAGNVLQSQPAVPTGYKVVQSGAAANLSFQPIGVGSSSATFTICRDTPIGNQNRVISVLATGSASVKRNDNTTTCP
jgi:type IV fimbrial biogenesis protein FimT